MPRQYLGHTKPPIQWVPGALLTGVTGPRRKADHSPATNTEVKNEWSFTSAPPLCLCDTQRDFTFLLC